jgi:hypothetical protein
MFLLGLLVLCGYFAAAGLRALVTMSKKIDEDEWVKNHPYHIFYKHENEHGTRTQGTGPGFLGAFLCIISLFAPLILLGEHCGAALWLAYAAGIASYLGVAFNYWAIKEIIREIKESSAEIKGWRQKGKTWWKSLVPAEVREAQEIQKALLSILKDGKRKTRKKLVPILKKVEKIIIQEIPQLLLKREQLSKLIEIAKQAIDHEKNNGIIEGEERLMAESETELEKLQKRHEEVKNKIVYILTSLDHLKIRFCTLIGLESATEIQREIDEIHQEMDILLTAREETEHLFADSSTPTPYTAKPTEKIMEEVAECLHGSTGQKATV